MVALFVPSPSVKRWGTCVETTKDTTQSISMTFCTKKMIMVNIFRDEIEGL